jgi:hypothetical protein
MALSDVKSIAAKINSMTKRMGGAGAELTESSSEEEEAPPPAAAGDIDSATPIPIMSKVRAHFFYLLAILHFFCLLTIL